MEYTDISKKKEEFVPRKSKEEFFRDGKVIKDLYNWTDFYICLELNVPFHDFTLCVYNHAYRICWMFTNGKSWDYDICDYDKFENNVVRNHSWMLVNILLTLNKFPLRLKTYLQINEMYPKKFYEACYKDKVEGVSLSHPINFRIPLPKPEEIEEIDFAQTKNYVMDTMNKAIKLQEEFKEQHWLLQVEKAKREEAEQKIKTLQTKLDAWENNDFYKAVNIDTIVNYVNEQRRNLTEHDVLIIQGMLNRLCRNKKLSDEAFKEIDNLTCGEKIGVQNNTGCQNFYGPITDSEFPSK